MTTAETRVAFIIRGVISQAMHDSGVGAMRLVDEPSAQSALIEKWSGYRFFDQPAALAVSSSNKTELLLNGLTSFADVTPLGDLYASELKELGGVAVLTGSAAEIALAAGGVTILDSCLRKLLDERYEPDAAFAASPDLHPLVLQRLNQNRFHLSRAGIVPKIGARTIGIDLFI